MSNLRSVSVRLGRLEERLAPKQDERDLRIAEVLRERWCRRQVEARGVPYEQILREHLAEHNAFWAGYAGDRTVADTLRYARWRRYRGLEVNSDVKNEFSAARIETRKDLDQERPATDCSAIRRIGQGRHGAADGRPKG